MRTNIFAHRGASSTHPENTMIAFREALRLSRPKKSFNRDW